MNYYTFEEIREKIKEKFKFEIILDRPYKLCDYKVAYGDIFKEEYDFWGYCDIDLLFGYIRSFITDYMLNKYEKIVYQGHSTLYKNIEETRIICLSVVDEVKNYKRIFTTPKLRFFDEDVFSSMYDKLKIPYYNEVNFAHLAKYDPNFHLGYFPKSNSYKNKYQVFIWDKGKLYRVYLFNNKVYYEEFMYIHFSVDI